MECKKEADRKDFNPPYYLSSLASDGHLIYTQFTEFFGRRNQLKRIVEAPGIRGWFVPEIVLILDSEGKSIILDDPTNPDWHFR